MTGWPSGSPTTSSSATTSPSSSSSTARRGAPAPASGGPGGPSGADSRYRVETPEQLGLEYDLAGLGTRGLAALVDAFILSMSAWIFFCIGIVALAGIVSAVPGLDDGITGAIALAILVLLIFTYVWGYYVFFETVWRGQTPGKQWLKLRVVREGGYQITFAQAAIRNIVRLADLLPGFYVVGALVMLFEPRSRRLGDMVAGTLVIREPQTLTLEAITTPSTATGGMPSTTAPGSAASTPPPGLLPGETPLPNLNRISAAESSLLGSYLQRRSGLRPDAAEHLARTLAPTFAQRIGYVPSGDVPAEFLTRLARHHAWYQAQPAGSVPAAVAASQPFSAQSPAASASAAGAHAYGSPPSAAPAAVPAPASPSSTWTPPPLPTFSPTPPPNAGSDTSTSNDA